MEEEQMASVARALAHPARVRIVRLLAGQSECRGGDVFSELPLAQSTISEHLRILKEAGVLSARPAGHGTVYCLAPAVLNQLATAIEEIIATTPECETAPVSRS